MVAYALGNRENEEHEIDILNEGSPDSINFSKSITISLFDYFSNKEKFVVPYSTIRKVKNARLKGAREVVYTATGRPDRFPHIKSLLELWGFSSYIEYLYTVAELGFLEGLIPVLDVGFLTPEEMKSISEIAALLKIPYESLVDYQLIESGILKAEQQSQFRLKNLEWAGKLQIPTITSVLIGSGLTKTKRKAQFDFIQKLHDKYGTIHEVSLDTFSLPKAIKGTKGSIPNKKEILESIELAKSILSDDIVLSINIDKNSKYIVDCIKQGVTDLGTIGIDYEKKNIDQFTFEQLDNEITNAGYVLHQRFPLTKKFIKEERYSKKLGQVFDAYRYKIKKEHQERIKESK